MNRPMTTVNIRFFALVNVRDTIFKYVCMNGQSINKNINVVSCVMGYQSIVFSIYEPINT